MAEQFKSEKAWKTYIASMENLADDTSTGKKEIRILSDALLKAVENDAAGPFGVLFSGGIDSTLIAFMAKNLGKKFTCYSAGLENSEDIVWAKRASKALKLKLKCSVLPLDKFEGIVKKVARILKEPDVTKVGVGSVFYAAASLAKKDKVKILFSGLGSEEIFAGYERHLNALNDGWKNVHNECWKGLKNMWQRDIIRDMKIAEKLDVKLLTPFLDKEVIIAAMRIHPKLKISKTEKKIVLRGIAVELGLPK